MKSIIVCTDRARGTMVAQQLQRLCGQREISVHTADAGFDYLWSHGGKLSAMILEADFDHMDEVRFSASNWPNIAFLLLGHFTSGDPAGSKNIVVIDDCDNARGVEDKIKASVQMLDTRPHSIF